AAEIEPRTETPSANPSASGRLTVIALGDVHELESHIPAWENLASHAIEPNVFQEHWMLLPALKQFAVGEQLILLVYAPHPQRPEEHGTLCGLFPLQRSSKYKGLPLSHLRLWRHLHAVLATPLVRAGQGPEVLHALFDWLRSDPRGARLLELG